MGILDIERLADEKVQKYEKTKIEDLKLKEKQKEYRRKIEEYTNNAIDEIVSSYEKLKPYFCERQLLCSCTAFGIIKTKNILVYTLSINVEDNEHYDIPKNIMKNFKKYKPRIFEWQSCYIDKDGNTYMDNTHICRYNKPDITGLIQVDRKSAIGHILNRAFTRKVYDEENLKIEKQNIKSFLEHPFKDPHNPFRHI